MSSDCIFCKIVAGEIPSYKVYEDKEFLGFLDISQVNDGHVLLVPKQHVRWIWDIEDLGSFMGVAKKIVKAMQKITGNDMVSPFAIGEEVYHAHLHLVPAGTEGNMGLVYEAWNRALSVRKLNHDKMQAIAEKYFTEIGGVGK